ncbi:MULTISPECIES: hypothetical protein [unclassified Bradyrhizobium]|uniref:hypothetical protein n=1 Tax=unclassified Bradyrhizobium TaxID=2631580 RepID=UPI001FF124FD|nr:MULTISPECIES: hypothetical protein [unclassified Bradyrhizobium]MCJ9701752.1 hypothetical protein [Bradyrhizobium sp. SHOUNA76]MCJ9733627.1 hypothetical protein [Bradyrhizobium sp. PRIMUS42]
MLHAGPLPSHRSDIGRVQQRQLQRVQRGGISGGPLFNSRTARTYSTVDLATRDLGVIKRDATDARARISRVQRVNFGDYVIPLPLGWRLSKMSASEIFFLTGRAAHCAPDDNFVQTSKITGFGPGDCVQRLILHQLRGDDLGTALREAQASYPPVKP